MKNITLLILIVTISSCTQDETDPIDDYTLPSEETQPVVIKNYNLTFSATHFISQQNQFCDPYAYFSWEIKDKDENKIFDKSGIIRYKTTNETFTAKTGDEIWIYISVNDVYDCGIVSCKSDDGKVNIELATDNMYIDEGTFRTLKTKGMSVITNHFILK